MGDIGTEVLADDDVPGVAEAAVAFLLDGRGHVFLDGVLFERGSCDLDALLLHLLRHVDVLDDDLGTHAKMVGRRNGRGRRLCHCDWSSKRLRAGSVSAPETMRDDGRTFRGRRDAAQPVRRSRNGTACAGRLVSAQPLSSWVPAFQGPAMAAFVGLALNGLLMSGVLVGLPAYTVYKHYRTLFDPLARSKVSV